MVASATTDSHEMVTIMGVRLEEGVREGRLTGESVPAAGNAKKFGGHFAKKKDQEVGMVAHGKPQQNFTPYRQVANVASAIPNPSYHQQRPHYPYPYPPQQYPPQQYPPQQYPPQQYHQPQYPQKQQNRPQPPQQPYHSQNRQKTTFDPIPMKYADLLPALLAKNLVQVRTPPRTPDVLPPWFRHDLTCAFHQGAPGHDVENCYVLKNEVQKLVRANLLSFKDQNPNVQANPLPNHGPAVNMIQDCDEDGVILNVQHVRTPLVPIHIKMCEAALFDHDHAACEICPVNVKGCPKVQEDVQELIDSRELIITRKDKEVCVITPEFQRLEISYNSGESTTTPLVISLPGPMLYASLKAVPYKYSATMLEGGQEVPLPSLTPAVSVDNVANDGKVLRNGRVIPTLFAKKVNDPAVKQVTVNGPGTRKEVGQSNGTSKNSDHDEILKLIQKSEYKVVDQLLQTPSKISILSLLLNSEAHREALMKVLDQAFVERDVTVNQLDSIVGNITACNNLSFSDEELPEEGRNHNLALHISVNCKSDALSNVLVDTGSSLNVMAKSTLDQLSYRGPPMRRSGVVVKAFDGSRKSVIGEVDLPITIGPFVFQITFQVMDIQAAYSCLLGRPWIHGAGAVTSTLHQKLKFVRNGRLITVSGEEALLVSHLSAFSFIGADETEGTSFQGLTVEGKKPEKNEVSFATWKSAQKVVQEGTGVGWGKVVQLLESKNREGLGFASSAGSATNSVGSSSITSTFCSAGFINNSPEANAVLEDVPEERVLAFVTPGKLVRNWDAVDIPSVVHASK
ncbi:uncharacterized protein [Glycine max]|uniref:uncharacterized protein n=1 Tax=Glycine max TaxID=3847 RepID=UPI001B3562E5|nr:uncharacterized protein LOC106799794 [Glycine max]